MRSESIHLTSHQKIVIATIVNSGGQASDDALARDNNLRGAFQQLVKMGMIANKERDVYALTRRGSQFATQDGVVDEFGELTDEAKGLITQKESHVPNLSFKEFLRTA